MPRFSKPVGNNPLVDLLDEDDTISGQKFCCISFLSPENIIKNKELFLFQEFLKKFDFTKSMGVIISLLRGRAPASIFSIVSL